jgi:hypothetical protein
MFFCFPTTPSLSGPWTYTYTEQLIWDIATELGWPWSPLKHFLFNTIFMYIGFVWDLDTKTIHIPDKKTKFLAKLLVWDAGNSVTALKCDSIINTLNHCCNVVVGGCSHLPTLYHFHASFKTCILSTRSQNLSHPTSPGGAHTFRLNGVAWPSYASLHHMFPKSLLMP